MIKNGQPDGQSQVISVGGAHIKITTWLHKVDTGSLDFDLKEHLGKLCPPVDLNTVA